ncbi:Uncharacterised protein [uncultured archaeon]|nr:Uncharacterised protein [uncultured archaeon]
MPRPTKGDQHVRGLLGNIAVTAILRAKMFVAADLFPICPVEKQSDKYVVYDSGDFLRDEAEERAPATESAGGGYDIDTSPYYLCRKYSYHHDVDDESRANADIPLNPDRTGVKFVSQKMLIKRERMVLGNFVKAGIWTSERTGVGSGPGANQFLKWSVSGSKPVKDVDTWRNNIEELTGESPNVLMLAPDVVTALKDNSDITSRIQYTERGIITPDILASLFEIEKVVVPRAIYNVAPKGATKSMQRIVAGKALLCYANKEPSTEESSAGYTFAWKGFYGASKLGTRIKKFRMEPLSADRIEGDLAIDPKIVAPDMGLLAASVV